MTILNTIFNTTVSESNGSVIPIIIIIGSGLVLVGSMSFLVCLRRSYRFTRHQLNQLESGYDPIELNDYINDYNQTITYPPNIYYPQGIRSNVNYYVHSILENESIVNTSSTGVDSSIIILCVIIAVLVPLGTLTCIRYVYRYSFEPVNVLERRHGDIELDTFVQPTQPENVYNRGFDITNPQYTTVDRFNPPSYIHSYLEPNIINLDFIH
jgi:hypothetical protein